MHVTHESTNQSAPRMRCVVSNGGCHHVPRLVAWDLKPRTARKHANCPHTHDSRLSIYGCGL